MRKTTDLGQLVKRLNHSQIVRFNASNKTLDEFLNTEDEELMTETIAVLTKLKNVHPAVEFEWK